MKSWNPIDKLPSSPQSSSASSSSVSVDLDLPMFFIFFRLAAVRRRAAWTKKRENVLTLKWFRLVFDLKKKKKFFAAEISYIPVCAFFRLQSFALPLGWLPLHSCCYRTMKNKNKSVRNALKMGCCKRIMHCIFDQRKVTKGRETRILPALQIHSTYPLSSRSSCCCLLSFKNSCLFSTFSLSLANSLQIENECDWGKLEFVSMNKLLCG